MDKVIFEDENEVKALTGTISMSDDFVVVHRDNKIIHISKNRIIKIEQSKVEDSGAK